MAKPDRSERRSPGWFIAITAVSLLSIAACTSTGDDADVRSSPVTPPTTMDSIPPMPEASPSSWLAVLGRDGLHLRLSDGSDDVVVADAVLQPSAPSFSPDGRLLAWSQIHPRDGRQVAMVKVLEPTRVAAVSAPVVGFYTGWSPDGSRIALLGSVGDRIGLAMVDAGAGGLGEVTIIASDDPFYVSWGPSSAGLLTHSGSGVRIIDADGAHHTILSEPGPYQAPIWLADGRMVIVEPNDGDDAITVVDGEERKVLVTTPGRVRLIADPTRSRIAVVVVEGPSSAPEVVNVAFNATPRITSGVAIIDVSTGLVRTVALEHRLFASFSPDGHSLLTLSAAGEASGVRRWEVWRDGRIIATTAFSPTGLVLSSQIPFFDQHDQAGTRWAPDGGSFVFARSREDGRGAEIVRFDVSDGEQTVVGSGRLALWSP